MTSKFLSFFCYFAIWLFESEVYCQRYPHLATYVITGSETVPFTVDVGGNTQYTPVYQQNKGSPSESIGRPGRLTPRAISPAHLRKNRLPTETVYGFLDFTTTIGSTVMVFTPQSEKERFVTSTKSVAFITAKPTLSRVAATKSPIEKEVTDDLLSSNNPPTGLAKLLQEAKQSKKEISRPLRHSVNSALISKPQKPKYYSENLIHKQGNGGSTIVPIIVEGRGILTPSTPILESSIYIPEEVVVSIVQTFPPIKLVSSINTHINGDSKNKFVSKLGVPKYVTPEPKPTGLITTLGGTKISKGQTTIHKTSVIGTYISGKYAQVLESTSKIYYENPSVNLISPSPNNYRTIKTLINGTPTQYLKPKSTATLPLESLFSSSPDRVPRYQDRRHILQNDSKLSKRTGATPSLRDDYYYYYDSKDQAYDEEYEDLARSASGVQPSFKRVYSPKPTLPTPTYRRPEHSTFRTRFKPGSTRNTPPSFLRKSSKDKLRNPDRFSNRSKLKVSKRPFSYDVQNKREKDHIVSLSSQNRAKNEIEEIVRVVSSTPTSGPTNVWYEIKILRSLHTFRVGTGKNTRYLTYTKTLTHAKKPTTTMEVAGSQKSSVYDVQLFEDFLGEENTEITTLPPINIYNKNLNSLLNTVTDTFRTTETMYKTSVLPVKQISDMHYHTLTQTYFITRIVSAIKTIPPVEAFEFIPSDSLNEFNSNLLAEGTENDAALLPGEQEFNENDGTRVPPPPGFKLPDANLADLASGKFNPEVLEKQMNPQLAAALKTHKNGGTPEVTGSKSNSPSPSKAATPSLSPEALQMAYLRLMNPYLFGGFPGVQAQQQMAVSSSPVVITTDVTSTATQVVRVIFNARPILKTLSSTTVIRTTITSYFTATVTAQPALPGLAFPFGGPMPFSGG